MNNTIKIIFGGALIAGIGFFTLNQINFSNSEKTIQEYIPRQDNRLSKANSAKGMQDIYEALRINVNTGKMEAGDFRNAQVAIQNMYSSANRAVTLQFIDEGPDNVGGRTRAILVDINDINTLYAGSVSGGLFKSTNRGNTWSRVNAFSTNLAISSIAQTNSGTIYVGTGSTHERSISNGASGGHRADGVWFSTDAGSTFQQLTPTPSFGFNSINDIVADPNENDKIWISGDFPVRLISCVNTTTFVTHPDISAGIECLKISADGNLIIAGSKNRTYVSNNAGGSFAKVSGFSAGQLKEIVTGSSIIRQEFSISHEKNSQGQYTIYAAQIKSGGMMAGISLSKDNGQTWTEVIPQTPNGTVANTVLTSDPFANGVQFQGDYDAVISTIPGDPEAFYVGGINIFKWNQSSTQAPFGQIRQVTIGGDQTNSIYAHSDQHEMVWDNTGRLYIGNDGGVGVVENSNGPFINTFPANRGYNVTQFYGIGYSKYGDLIGGAQDNSTTYKNINNPGTTPLEFRTVFGGDGFDCDISYLNPDVLFMSSQNVVINRSPDKGVTSSDMLSSEMIGLPGTFYTTLRLFENENDTNSTDSLTYIAKEPHLAGETIMVPSKNMDILNPHVLTQDLTVTYDSVYISGNDTIIDGESYQNGDTAFIINYQDTIKIQDKLQTLFATGLSSTGGVWVTRGALRFGTTPVWWKVLNSVDQVKSLEFSKDGNILYVGEWSGKVTRIKGFNNVYYNNEAHDTINGINDQDSISYKYADVRSGVSQLDIQVIYNGGSGRAATGIAIDPNDSEHVVITLGGYGSPTNIISSTTAASTTTATSFTSIQGDLPNMPVFDAIIDVTNSNVIVIGTEFGMFASDNNGVNWTAQITEMGQVPVYDVRQQWRPWNQCNNTGVIYAGTHGRGIWSSSTLLSVDKNTVENTKVVSTISIYPNPANETTNLAFDLTERGDITIKVFNIQGKIIESKELKNVNKGNRIEKLNLNSYSKGTYFVAIQSKNETFKVAKFIKK